MANYILTVNIAKLFEDPAIDIWFYGKDTWDLKEIIPWLDPAKGRVRQCIEGVQCRQRTARSAEIAVEAEKEFPEFLESQKLPIESEEVNGRIMIDIEGRLYHIGAERITELTGDFAHDVYRMVPLYNIVDLQEDLTREAKQYIETKIDEEIGVFGHDPDAALYAESIDEAMRGLDDLTAVTFKELDRRSVVATEILGKKYFGEV